MAATKTTTNRSTVVGVFDDHARAQECVEELRREGFRDDQIGLIRKGDEEEFTHAEGSKAGTGAAVGAATGAGVAALTSLGMTFGMIPVIGPVLAIGPLAAALLSAAGGAAAGGIVGGLVGMGVPEEEAKFYESELHGGRTLVTVRADGRYEQALAILRRHGAHCEPTATSRTGVAETTARRTSAGAESIELHEEQLHAHKEPVETGEARVKKQVVTEQKSIDVPVQREEVVVERHPVTGRAATSGEIHEGEEIRIPVTEEQVRVEKQPVVKEEIRVGKRKVQGTEHVADTVRREEVQIEREGDIDVKDERRK